MHVDVILATGLLLLLQFLSLLLFLFLAAGRRWIAVRDSTQIQAGRSQICWYSWLKLATLRQPRPSVIRASVPL